MENDLVDKTKYNFFSIPMQGVRGKGILHWVKTPFFLVKAIFSAFLEVKKVKPDFVILMGGYICFPVAVAAKLLKIHIIIHEQNAIPGLSNSLLSYISQKIFLGFELKKLKGEVIGNPIRHDLFNIEKPSKRFLNRSGPLRILVMGGSLGAMQFNRTIPQILHSLSKNKKIKVIHQSGKKHYQELVDLYHELDVDIEVKNFLYDMNYYYSWADILIARSGAITVSELSQIGVASILIPYPFAVDNHQYYNARILEQRQGAYIILQENIETELPSLIKKLTRSRCQQMAEKAKQDKTIEPCDAIYKYCLEAYEG